MRTLYHPFRPELPVWEIVGPRPSAMALFPIGAQNTELWEFPAPTPICIPPLHSESREPFSAEIEPDASLCFVPRCGYPSLHVLDEFSGEDAVYDQGGLTGQKPILQEQQEVDIESPQGLPFCFCVLGRLFDR